MELKDKVVLITGSSDGIGAEAAKLFSKEGAKTIITWNTQKEKAENILKECEKFSECLILKLDVTDINSIEKGFEDIIDGFGGIDILVNNAGVVIWEDLIEQSFHDIKKQIEVNLLGTINVTKFVLRYFQAQGEGVVINIGSSAGKTGYGEIAPYCATKFAVRGFTKAMAEEFDKNKIRFYCVNPGTTKTKMTDYQGVHPEKVAEVIVNCAKEIYGKRSGDDIDVEDSFSKLYKPFSLQ